jgi:hypothetical protein
MEQTFKAVIMQDEEGAVQIAFFAEDGDASPGCGEYRQAVEGG